MPRRMSIDLYLHVDQVDAGKLCLHRGNHYAWTREASEACAAFSNWFPLITGLRTGMSKND